LWTLHFFTGGAKWSQEDHFSKHHLLSWPCPFTMGFPSPTSQSATWPEPIPKPQHPCDSDLPSGSKNPEEESNPQNHFSELPSGQGADRQPAEKRKGQEEKPCQGRKKQKSLANRTKSALRIVLKYVSGRGVGGGRWLEK
jgi:hypothetical protein